MKTIRLSDKEIEFLATLYEDEIRQTEAYLNQLKEISGKLGKKIEPKPVESKPEPKKRGRKPGKLTGTGIKPKRGKKRGRKPKKASKVPQPAVKATPKTEPAV